MNTVRTALAATAAVLAVPAAVLSAVVATPTLLAAPASAVVDTSQLSSAPRHAVAVRRADLAQRDRATWSSNWAQHRPKGVEAHGSWSRTGTTVHFYGGLTDTRADHRAVRLDVEVSGHPNDPLLIPNTGGKGFVQPVDVRTTKAAHLKFRVVTYNNSSRAQVSDWVSLF